MDGGKTSEICEWAFLSNIHLVFSLIIAVNTNSFKTEVLSNFLKIYDKEVDLCFEHLIYFILKD